MINYYEVLKISPKASHEEIKKAYRKRIKECHPDQVQNMDDDIKKMAEEKMRKVNEAYSVLNNPDSRAEYDRSYSGHKESATPFQEKERDVSAKKIEEQYKKAKKEKRSIVIDSFLKSVEENIKNHNRAVKWNKEHAGNFDFMLKGRKRMEEYLIYFKVFERLGEPELQSVIRRINSINIKPGRLWSIRFTTICLVAEGFSNLSIIKETVKKYNLQHHKSETLKHIGKIIIAIVDLTTRKVFSPFSDNFKPILKFEAVAK